MLTMVYLFIFFITIWISCPTVLLLVYLFLLPGSQERFLLTHRFLVFITHFISDYWIWDGLLWNHALAELSPFISGCICQFLFHFKSFKPTEEQTPHGIHTPHTSVLSVLCFSSEASIRFPGLISVVNQVWELCGHDFLMIVHCVLSMLFKESLLPSNKKASIRNI